MSKNGSLEILHNAAKDRYEFEIDRIRLLDDKANNLVSISSILAALVSGFAILSAKESDPTFFEVSLFSIFLVCLIFLISTLGLSIKAYQIRSYIIVPDIPNLIVDCEKMKPDKIFETLYINYAIATHENETKNENKVSYVKMASWLLLGAITLFAAFVLLSIIHG